MVDPWSTIPRNARTLNDIATEVMSNMSSEWVSDTHVNSSISFPAIDPSDIVTLSPQEEEAQVKAVIKIHSDTISHGMRAFWLGSGSRYLYSNCLAQEEDRDIILSLLEIANTVERTVVFLDWTSDSIENQIRTFISGRSIGTEYFMIVAPNDKKDVKSPDYSNSYTMDGIFKVSKTEVRSFPIKLMESQFERFSNPVPMIFDHFSHEIKAQNNTILGIIGEDIAQIWYDPRSFSKLRRRILAKDFNLYLADNIGKIRNSVEKKAEKLAKGYNTFIKNSRNKISHEINSKIRNLQAEKDSHMKGLLRCENDLLELDARKVLIEKQDQTLFKSIDEASLRKIFTNFLKADKYTKIEFADSIIVAQTGMIHLTSYEKKYPIGTFSIEIRMDGTIKMFNQTKRWQTRDHPHVNEGNPCLGTIKEHLPKMIHRGDFVNILSLAHDFLTSYNEPGAYVKVEEGWGAPEDFCPKCINAKLACKCTKCPKCKIIMKECSCKRCPRLGFLYEQSPCKACKFFADPSREDRIDQGKNPICLFGTGLLSRDKDYGSLTPIIVQEQNANQTQAQNAQAQNSSVEEEAETL